MMKDTMPQVARFWNDIADEFDAIYTGKQKSSFARALDQWFRSDIYQRFDWVMERSGDVRGKDIVDIGCGSGRFVTELVKRGANHVTGVDVAPEMLKLSQQLVAADGTASKCDFVLADVLNWTPQQAYDITITIERLKIIRSMTKGTSCRPGPDIGLGACLFARYACNTTGDARSTSSVKASGKR